MGSSSPGLRITPAQRLSEGAGVVVNRTIGTEAFRTLDPFLMLDHFNSTNPGDYIAGFPDHPHRGFVTLTYLLEGHMLHWDSLGNRGDLVSGGAQWMKAARGVIHSEMPRQTEGRMSGFQLWINLPAKEKMSDPAYQEVLPGEIPVFRKDGVLVRILAGSHAGLEGPIRDGLTHLTYLDVTIDPDRTFPLSLAPSGSRTSFLYGIDGDLTLGDQALLEEAIAVVDNPAPETRSLTVRTGSRGGRFLFVSGQPVREPVAAYGPFVMNTRKEIEQAIDDYRNNRFAP
jgi:redox-sensitive bicupin YhaK (pirin superfamily)